MIKTLQDILIDVNAFLDQEAELPTGEDLTTRTQFAKKLVDDWGNAYTWRAHKQVKHSYATGATISLGNNFKKLLSPIYDTSGSIVFSEVLPEEHLEIIQEDPSDRHCYIELGDNSSYNLILNNHAIGVTLSWTQQRHPSNMATLSDVCEVPDSNYVTKGVISEVLASRLDERFPQYVAMMNESLMNMIATESQLRPGGIPTVRRMGASAYVVGRRR